jgi:hypothetical protein
MVPVRPVTKILGSIAVKRVLHGDACRWMLRRYAHEPGSRQT